MLTDREDSLSLASPLLISFAFFSLFSLSSKTPSESRASSVKPEEASAAAATADEVAAAAAAAAASGTDGQLLLPFPSGVELNGRLRRLITSYQREFKKEEARQAAKDKRNERRERIEQVIREREQQKIDMQQKSWSRREEQDFLRTLMAYGVEYSKEEGRYNWDRFKQLARLEKKFDDTVTDYYNSFVAMCKRSAGLGEANNDEGEFSLTGIDTIVKNLIITHVFEN